MDTSSAAPVQGTTTRTMVNGHAYLLTCRCGQDLNLCLTAHCPRCGANLPG